MPLRLRELYLPLEHTCEDLRAEAAARLGLRPEDLVQVEPLRRAVDARRKGNIRFVYTVLVRLGDAALEEAVAAGARGSQVALWRPEPVRQLAVGRERLSGPVAVVGAGPAGLFAALRLAEAGYAPLVIERGRPVEERSRDVAVFARGLGLDPESNVVFGEGGAGTFSDGKLTHRTESPEAALVLRVLRDCGAGAELLVDARPHVGSDVLPSVVAALRRRIEGAGGRFLFGRRAAAFVVRGGELVALELAEPGGSSELRVGAVLLAPGASARDTWRALLEAGIELRCRPTLIGIRVEHPQELVDRAQYGGFAGHPALGPAEYFLKCAGSPRLRPVHSFCMCPGGQVIAVASSPGMLSTNGMSRRARDSGFANAALVAPVGPRDYGGERPLAGAEFLERLERAVFEAGGGDWSLPCARLIDFVNGRRSRALPDCPAGTRRKNADLRGMLPRQVEESIVSAVRRFARQVRGFLSDRASVYAAELRAGSPVRVLRGEDGSSPSARGLFPAGEGAGYSGGIVSSAVDGLNQAARLISRFAPP